MVSSLLLVYYSENEQNKWQLVSFDTGRLFTKMLTNPGDDKPDSVNELCTGTVIRKFIFQDEQLKKNMNLSLILISWIN